jgi:transglutaminase-like putative cysteine protease
MRTVPILLPLMLCGLASCNSTSRDDSPHRTSSASLSPADVSRAGKNGPALQGVVEDIPAEVGLATARMLSTMPDADLQTLTAGMLRENAEYADRAWKKAPWGGKITAPTFAQYLLPYASLNERRDNWRKDFYDRFHGKAWSFENPLDAAKWLNSDFKGTFGVEFHATKRPKPDQSPYESMEAHYASCTGMSVLLTDACRAVGVPARIVGVPKWKGMEGNHNWVEVWGPVKQEGGTVWSWHAVGEAGGDPRDLNWVHDRCREATDPEIPESMVYAAVHRPNPPEGRHFPLVWDESYRWVPALNVTRFYKTPAAVEYTPPAGVSSYRIVWKEETVAVVEGSGRVKLPLAKGEEFWVVWDHGGERSALLRP